MATTRKKSEGELSEETREVSRVESQSEPATTKVTQLRVKEKIPMDEMVYVRNLTGGKLVYIGRNGYYVEWQEFGEEQPVEMRELYNMKGTDRRFFTENWIEVDLAVLRDLHMDSFYKDAISYDEIEDIKNGKVDKLIAKMKKAQPIIKNSIGVRIMNMIESGELSNINTIKKLEEAVGCELFQR